MYNYKDSDDDIFDDSTSLTEDAPSYQSSSSVGSSENSHSHTEDEINFASFLDSVFDGANRFDSDSGKVLITFVVNFYETMSKWINSGYSQYFYRAIFDFNDHMLQGVAKPFVFYERFYSTINTISKRRIINLFLKEVLDDPQTIVSLSTKIRFPITEQEIKIYFSAFYNINQYAILEEYANHISFAEYLNLQPVTAMMENVNLTSIPSGMYPYDIDVHHRFANAVTEEYSEILSKNMKESIEKFVNIEKTEENKD